MGSPQAAFSPADNLRVTQSNVYGILVGVRARNASSPTEYFRLPDDHVVNVGTQIVI